MTRLDDNKIVDIVDILETLKEYSYVSVYPDVEEDILVLVDEILIRANKIDELFDIDY